ncbi:UDP-glucose 4-epimerase GalE [Modestobacter sp. NPDC049651]|uniref:UDP-glucose 4-epimerase GalE n=1 Tax=unclassified Modestobacter TaxID=2643866 RepID=UPI0033DEF0B1
MTWLVTGGAGYIGAHVVSALSAADQRVVVLDDLSTGSLDRVGDAPLVVASVHDQRTVASTIRDHSVTGIIHLAGKKAVPESMADPLRYYQENVEGLRRLLAVATDEQVRAFLFSSSAAVYGAPDLQLVTEEAPCRPVNPYGESKLIGEWLLAAVGRASGLPHLSLRYFNVAGAGSPALADTTVANLMTQVFSRLERGLPPLVFGGDHPTPDGTCIRDFVHVADLADAHVAAALALAEGRVVSGVLNIGRGVGVSVKEVCRLIAETTRETHPAPAPVVVDRRAGDPAQVVGSARRAAEVLGWTASRDVADMVRSAWAGWREHHAGPAMAAHAAQAV